MFKIKTPSSLGNDAKLDKYKKSLFPGAEKISLNLYLQAAG